MFQHKRTEFLEISMNYFFDCANILEVKTYNNTLLTECIIVSAERKNKKFETNAVFRDAYAVRMIMPRQ